MFWGELDCYSFFYAYRFVLGLNDEDTGCFWEQGLFSENERPQVRKVAPRGLKSLCLNPDSSVVGYWQGESHPLSLPFN